MICFLCSDKKGNDAAYKSVSEWIVKNEYACLGGIIIVFKDELRTQICKDCK